MTNNISFAREHIEAVKNRIISAKIEARKWEIELKKLEDDLEEEIKEGEWRDK